MTETRTLAERMASAMARLDPPAKNGRMVLQGKAIPYVVNDDLMESLRPALATEGVAFSISVEEVRKGISDSVGIQLAVRLACAGEALEARAYGEGRTVPIAQTYAVKYWLLRTFLVGAGGEDDEVHQAALEEKPARPQARVSRQPEGERRVAQTGSTREAPATAFREDPGRKALLARLDEAFRVAFASGLEGEAAVEAKRQSLSTLAQSHPDMVPVVDGRPDLRSASNDQLQRLVAYAENQAGGQGEVL